MKIKKTKILGKHYIPDHFHVQGDQNDGDGGANDGEPCWGGEVTHFRAVPREHD